MAKTSTIISATPTQPFHSWLTVARLITAITIISAACLALLHFFSHHPWPPAIARLSTFHTLPSLLGQKFYPIIRQQRVQLIRSNPRFKGNYSREIIIRDAKLFNGDGWVNGRVDILIKGGVIQDISPNIAVAGVVEEVFAHGRHVTPGLVDMHSHMGVQNIPYNEGLYDLFELSADLTPYVRSLDAIYTSDDSFPIVASGGVTTSLILPGSTNIVGGEAFAVKNAVPQSLSVNEMLVEEGVAKPQRHMKFACGMNPKKFHANFPERPKSRMGMAWALRELFERAQNLKREQDSWNATKAVVKETRFPFSLELESTVALLRGEVRTHIHCYTPHDFEAFIRTANEFHFNITAFHHAVDAYLVPDILKRAGNITIAIMASSALYSKESYGLSVFAAKVLEQNGIPVAVHSDHPVLNAKHLTYEAAINYHFGQSEIGALKSFTSVPAAALGLDHRVGYAKIGYDADLVLWDEHPLRLGASPMQVWIDGSSLYNFEKVKTDVAKLKTKDVVSSSRPSQRQTHGPPTKGCTVSATNMILKGISRTFLKNFDDVSGDRGNITLVMKAGRVICIGNCSTEERQLEQEGVVPMVLKNAWVVPGITQMSVALGLSEIDGDPTTQDGTLESNADLSNLLYAKHGLVLTGKHLDFARRSGVLQAVTAPNRAGLWDAPKSLFRGVSTVFRTGAYSVLDHEAILKDEVALHIRIGQDGKGYNTPTISSEIAALRELLSTSSGKPPVVGKVLSGDTPLVVECGNKDVIAHIIKVKQDYPKVKLVIQGGQEAWMLANQIATSNISVILSPWRCLPMTFETRNCLPGPPLSDSSIYILHRAGVKLGLALDEDAMARNQWFEAGWAKKLGKFNEKDAVALVTTSIEEILGLQDVFTAERQLSNFVVFEDSPLEFGATPAVFVERGVVTDCWPEPE